MFKLAWNRAVYLGEPFLQAVWPAFYYMKEKKREQGIYV